MFCTRPEIRTLNLLALNQSALPIGVDGQYVRWCPPLVSSQPLRLFRAALSPVQLEGHCMLFVGGPREI